MICIALGFNRMTLTESSAEHSQKACIDIRVPAAGRTQPKSPNSRCGYFPDTMRNIADGFGSMHQASQ